MAITLPNIGTQPTKAEPTCATTSNVELTSRSIPEDAYPGLDLEWRVLWNTHGSHIMRSDEVALEEYRKDPAKYSFSYATHKGKTPYQVV